MMTVPKLVVFGMVVAISANAAQIKEIKNPNKIESKTIQELLPVVNKIHKAADKELSWERRALVHKVVPDSEGEKQAIFELTDKVNTFGSADDEESVEVKKMEVSFTLVYQAFLSDYDKEEAKKLPASLKASIGSLTNELKKITNNPNMAFYRISSSNESQGHVGFVLYNRRTDETLYVSVVSDH